MADYVATNRQTQGRFLIRRADSENHARQLLRENIPNTTDEDFDLVALAAGSVVEIPVWTPPVPEAPPLQETDNPFSGSPAG